MSHALLHHAEGLLDRRKILAALAYFHRAEAAGASADRCAAGRWMAHMLAGDFAAAWGESDAIRKRGAADPHRFWNGESPEDKRMMVRCLHGYGDTVQFLRYAPRLKSLASRLIVQVAPRMVELTRCLECVDEVITWGAGAPATPPAWDVQVEVMELPYLFRTVRGDLPLAVNYLQLPQRRDSIKKSSGPAIGLVWAAGEWNPGRSVPFSLLQPLLQTPGCEWWNLQGGHARELWEGGARCGEGIMELASTIAQLDLVITVDTLAAHLAGAMGKPAWVLLQHAADWRWMDGHSHSPWYPSLRLFRQPRPGDWESTVRAVQRELQEWPVQVAA